MANTDDLVSSYCARLEKLIQTQIKHLIGCSRDQHDRTAGRIAGLQEAQQEITELSKKWRSRDGEGD
jgi:HPt (histidine-containing phosphotransfer) domain-containing protein